MFVQAIFRRFLYQLLITLSPTHSLAHSNIYFTQQFRILPLSSVSWRASDFWPPNSSIIFIYIFFLLVKGDNFSYIHISDHSLGKKFNSEEPPLSSFFGVLPKVNFLHQNSTKNGCSNNPFFLHFKRSHSRHSQEEEVQA